MEIFKNSFINLCLAVLDLRCCVGFLQLQRAGAALQLQCMGFPLRWLLLLWSSGCRAYRLSVVGEHGLSSCRPPGSRAQAQQLWCWGLVFPFIWDLHGSKIELCLPLSHQGSPRIGINQNQRVLNFTFRFQLCDFEEVT